MTPCWLPNLTTVGISGTCCSQSVSQSVSAHAAIGIRQVQIVTNARDLFTHGALVLFITDVISGNERRKEKGTVFSEGEARATGAVQRFARCVTLYRVPVFLKNHSC